MVTLAFSFMVVRTKIRSERLRERGTRGGAKWSFHARFSFSSSFSRRGSDKILERKERKKERKNGKKERSKSHNRTEHRTTCSAPLPLDFFYIIYIFLFINYKLSFFLGGRFLLLLFVCFYFCLYFLWASACARVCRWGESLVLDCCFCSSARVEGWDLKWRGLH